MGNTEESLEGLHTLTLFSLVSKIKQLKILLCAVYPGCKYNSTGT